MMIQNSVSVLIRMTSQRIRALSGAISLFVLAFFVLAPLTAQGLGEGDPAPEFLLSGSDGKRVSLQGLLEEHSGVVLAFFPRAFTPG